MAGGPARERLACHLLENTASLSLSCPWSRRAGGAVGFWVIPSAYGLPEMLRY